MTDAEIEQMKKVVKKICARAGHPVLMGTDFCDSYRRTHSDCFGCSAKIGCDKLATFMFACSRRIQIPLDFFDHWDGWEQDKKRLI